MLFRIMFENLINYYLETTISVLAVNYYFELSSLLFRIIGIPLFCQFVTYKKVFGINERT